jgi:hypothetical protein
MWWGLALLQAIRSDAVVELDRHTREARENEGNDVVSVLI